MKYDPELRSPTAAETAVASALVDCRLPPRSADLRFILEVERAAACRIALMNPGRRAYLWRIANRYSNRLSPQVREIADGLRPARDL